MRWEIYLVRESKNRLNPETTRKKLRLIAEAAGRNRSLGFTARVTRMGEPETLLADGETIHRYVVKIRIDKDGVQNEETVQDKYEHVLRVITKCAFAHGWTVVTDPTKPVEDLGSREPILEARREPFTPPALTTQAMRTFFAGVYERDPHIHILHSAVRTCCESAGEMLSHVLLYGKPGACKTKLCKRFKSWYESDLPDNAVPRVLLLNNISTTKAGLENLLLELAAGDRLPYVVVVDEIEKQPMENLLSLNTVMSEGVVTKLNAHVGNRRETVKFTVIGITNDENKLRSFQSGHLWSRFTHHLCCERPSRELCLHILREEATKLPDYKPDWADAALRLGWDELGERDIRTIRGHLDGRDDLLNGKWQRYKRAIVEAARRENLPPSH